MVLVATVPSSSRQWPDRTSRGCSAGELREVLRGHGVSYACIFGSVVRGDDHQGSDVDILVDFAPRTGLLMILRIQAELEEILGVDLTSCPCGLMTRVRARVQRDLIAL